jgi:serine/threonine-protein kinase PknG
MMPSMDRCDRPRCDGRIEDGYCTTCGLAPLGAPVTAGATAHPAKGAGSSTSARSGRTSSTRSIRSTRSTRSGSTRSSSRRAFGGGIIPRPPLPPQDPLAALVPGVVPDRKRLCSSCDAKLSREQGFCPKCGQEYSFKPSLNAGDIVAGKYEIKGTIAFGGLGWIYLALDTVLSRWVVLKGLLNSKDPSMVALAVKEREFLAAVKHRAIVGIYDFITHGTEGFIVMEYVNGKTLMTLRKEHGGPLPVAETISYLLDVLPAFAYLDEMGLVYCDFKPENAMVEGDSVKLIDMGAVRRADDLEGDIYGSRGYAAPEASDEPTPVSDLYSVARALGVLIANFDFQGRYEHSLPPADEVPVFQQHESLYRFLVKATRPSVDTRFQTAEEMAGQLVGVLREVVAGTADIGQIDSALFEGDGDLHVETSGTGTTGRATRGLPAVKLDPEDPAAGVILAAASVREPARRGAMFERALTTHPESIELQLRTANELIEMGAFAQADELLARVQSAGPYDWRPAWYRGRLLLAQDRPQEAVAAFQSVYDELPGELAPKLALGYAHEMAGDLDHAMRYYHLVSRVDPSLTSAAFGLARCLEIRGDRDGAVAAYERVPATSSRHPAAQIGIARVLLGSDGARPGAADLVRASAAIEGLREHLDGLERHQLCAQLLQAAAASVEAATVPADESIQVLGIPLLAKPLRLGAERELRACARFATEHAARIRFVDEANRVRPRTLF